MINIQVFALLLFDRRTTEQILHDGFDPLALFRITALVECLIVWHLARWSYTHAHRFFRFFCIAKQLQGNTLIRPH